MYNYQLNEDRFSAIPSTWLYLCYFQSLGLYICACQRGSEGSVYRRTLICTSVPAAVAQLTPKAPFIDAPSSGLDLCYFQSKVYFSVKVVPTRNIMEPENQYNQRWPSHKYLHVFVMLWFPRSGPSDCQTSSKIFLRPPRPLPSVTVLPTRDLRLNKSFLKNLRNAKKVLGCKEVLLYTTLFFSDSYSARVLTTGWAMVRDPFEPPSSTLHHQDSSSRY